MERLQERLLVPRILWGAFIMTQVVFVGVLMMLRAGGSVPDAPAEPVIAIALAISSLGVVAVSFVLPARLMKTSMLASKLEVAEQPDPNAIGMYRETAPKVRVFSDPERAIQKLSVAYQTAFIIGVAMSEAVGVHGLVLGLLGFELSIVLPFFAVGVVLIAIRFPRPAAIIAALEAAYDAKLPQQG